MTALPGRWAVQGPPTATWAGHRAISGWRWSYPVVVLGLLLSVAVLSPTAARAAAAGNAKAYALIGQVDGRGAVTRWDPCGGPIDYRVNLARAPKNSLPEVKLAFAAVARATGLTFRYAGATAVIPAAKKGYNLTYPVGTDMVIAWATPGVHSTMLPRVRGLAGMGGYGAHSAFTVSGAEAWRIDEGKVVLSAAVTKTMARGFAAKRGGTTGQLLMHEIGHAVGLGHPAIKDPSQIMYPMMTNKRAVWGAGDLVGLRKVGTGGNCLYDRKPNAPSAAS